MPTLETLPRMQNIIRGRGPLQLLRANQKRQIRLPHTRLLQQAEARGSVSNQQRRFAEFVVLHDPTPVPEEGPGEVRHRPELRAFQARGRAWKPREALHGVRQDKLRSVLEERGAGVFEQA